MLYVQSQFMDTLMLTTGALLSLGVLSVGPSPATHAILTLLEAGESGIQPLLLMETVFHALRGAQPVLHAIFGVKTLSGILLGPAFNASGLRGTGRKRFVTEDCPDFGGRKPRWEVLG